MSHPLTPREKLKLELRGGGGAPPRLPQRPAPPPAAVQPARPISSVFPETTEADRRRFGLATIPQPSPSREFSFLGIGANPSLGRAGRALGQVFAPFDVAQEVAIAGLQSIPSPWNKMGLPSPRFDPFGFIGRNAPRGEQATQETLEQLGRFIGSPQEAPNVFSSILETARETRPLSQQLAGAVLPFGAVLQVPGVARKGVTGLKAVGRQFRAPAGQVIDTPTSPAVQRVLGILKKTAPEVEKITKAQRAEQARRVGVAARRIKEDPGSVLEPLTELGGPLPSRQGGRPLAELITPGDIAELGELVVKGSRTPSDVVNNSDALTRLLAKGEVPQPADLRRLERLFGTDFVKEVVRIKRLGPGAWDHVADAANLPRALLSSADVSFGLRQGAMLGLSNPKQWGKAWVGQFKVMFSERKFGEMMKAIEADELFPLLEQSKVDLTQRVGRLGVKLAQGEERFQSSFAQIFPWVRGSERSYTMMANQLRSGVFYKKARLLLGEGKNFKTHPEEFLDLGRHINWLTGRGPIPKKMQGIAPLLNGIFFAPRLFAGTVATPSLMFKGTQRAATAKALATFFAANGTILALANMHPDIDVEANPLSSDFGKMRIGKTRVHFLGPWQPLMVAISRVLRAGQRKTLGSGTIIDTDISEEVMAFFRNKLQPVSGLGLDISLGEDAIGREVRAANIFLGPGESIPERISEGELWQHTAGMAIQDTVDALIKEGPLHGLLAAPAFAGMAAQTFETSRSVREEETQRQFPGRKYDDLEFLEKQKVDDSEAVQRWFVRRREEGPPPLRPQGELSFGMQRLTAVNLELEQGLRLKIDAGRSGQALARTIKDWKAARVNSAEALITPAAEQLIEERQQGDLERALRSKYWSIEVPENATTGELDFGAWKRQRDQVLAEAVAQGVKEEVILDRTGRFTDPVVRRVVEGYEADQEALREYYEIPEQVITDPELLSIYRTRPQFERSPKLRKMAQLITRKRQVLRLTNCDIDALLVKWRGAKALCPGGQR